MPIYTTELFLERARKIHGDKFSYENVNYTGTYNDVEIICPIHGSFYQKPKKHLMGHGCSSCNIAKKTYHPFVYKANKKHGSYDYSNVQGEPKSRDIIEIICPEHGSFSQMVKNHLAGSGCPACGKLKNSRSRLKSKQEFIDGAIRVHGNRYSYEHVSYEGTLKDVSIECEVHGIFKQKPAYHLSGCGCPACTKSGFKSNLRGFIYIQKITADILKIGITNNPETRIEQINSKCLYSPKYIHIFTNEDGKVISNLESLIKSNIECGFIDKNLMNDGYTETFQIQDLEKVLTYIRNSITTMEIYI